MRELFPGVFIWRLMREVVFLLDFLTTYPIYSHLTYHYIFPITDSNWQLAIATWWHTHTHTHKFYIVLQKHNLFHSISSGLLNCWFSILCFQYHTLCQLCHTLILELSSDHSLPNDLIVCSFLVSFPMNPLPVSCLLFCMA